MDSYCIQYILRTGMSTSRSNRKSYSMSTSTTVVNTNIYYSYYVHFIRFIALSSL